ncbi:Ig-like domain-containing protein [Clostridium oryzae]|uniref:Beta-N-acetylglucosaminidase n=1 Tax=Clostridium oryzae TaxID=1450648 RepID=A0A1V4IGY6_9CLOT|nr:Ig-like domain-containing protein [Clostridium oryzae]OPJ59179.1 beta-N-acetylglucosaminidase precursor [Clostridium oryzae]
MKKQKSLLILFMSLIFMFYGIAPIEVHTTTLPPRMALDSLKNNMVVSSDELLIKGWAINSSGVDKVNIYVDGKFKAAASYGSIRSDVSRLYPNHMNSNKSGYSYKLSVVTLKTGTHKITVQAVGRNKTIASISRYFVVTNLPKVKLESIKDNQVIENKSISVKGWAIAKAGINKVKVFVDDKYIGSAKYGIKRSDIKKLYPSYINSYQSGYQYTIDINKLLAGRHKITVQAIDKKGVSISTYKYVTVKKSVPIVKIETPIEGYIYDNVNVLIKGWAVNDSGVKAVNLYLDGKYLAKAAYGASRPDIFNKYSQYRNSKYSGFTYKIDIRKLSNGKHKISVEAVGNDGSKVSDSRNVEKNKLVTQGALEKPSDGADIDDGNITLTGWAINKKGIKSIKVYLNDKYKKTIYVGVSRSDIVRKYPEYPIKYTSASGYSTTIDTYTTRAGKGVVKVVVTANDGTVKTYMKTVNIIKKPAKLCIDTPKVNDVVKESTINIKGWALNDSGIKEVQVNLDGKFISKATIGIVRKDVNSKYKSYRFGDKSGFEYTMDSSTLSIGKHTITVKAIGYDGTYISSSVNVTMYGIVQYRSYPVTLKSFVDMELNKGGNVYGNTAVSASRSQIKYYMNPANFWNSESGKYMFLKLSYFPGISKADLNTILKGKGVLDGKESIFLQAGKESNVNPIYLVSHALLETGNGTSKLSNGSLVVNGKKVYNMYGIGAVDGNANTAGAQKAYNEGWYSADSAILGGAKFISANYVNNRYTPQDTLYEMRWNYDNMGHQYATDVRWAGNQLINIKRLVDLMSSSTFYYKVPKFKTPSTPVVTIDAAYGGNETGVTANGITEKNLTKDMAVRIGNVLKKSGIKVVYTRSNDSTVSVDQRVSISNTAGSDYFVSIQAHDKYIYYYPSSKSKLGSEMAKAINSAINTFNISKTSTKETKNITILSKTNSPAVLLNVGDIRDSDQAEFLTDSTYKNEISKEIANQIIDFVK